MPTSPVKINKEQLLKTANKLIIEHEDYINGMCATTVTQKGDVLVFGGEYFLDDNGLPTPKSTLAFNMFKYLAHHLSDKYQLADDEL
jgi:hypothetical protein